MIDYVAGAGIILVAVIVIVTAPVGRPGVWSTWGASLRRRS